MKPRYESLQLKILSSLFVRMNLAPKDENDYFNMEATEKGKNQPFFSASI
jgi:hypothetical protein